jgi:hypothetical protein
MDESRSIAKDDRRTFGGSGLLPAWPISALSFEGCAPGPPPPQLLDGPPVLA